MSLDKKQNVTPRDLDDLDARNRAAVGRALEIPGYYLERPNGLALFYLHRNDGQILPLAISPNLAWVWATRGFCRVIDFNRLERNPHWRYE